jgi:hypothetical protein
MKTYHIYLRKGGMITLMAYDYSEITKEDRVYLYFHADPKKKDKKRFFALRDIEGVDVVESSRDTPLEKRIAELVSVGVGEEEMHRMVHELFESAKKPPNQALEPTSTAVTPPAVAGDRASGTRGSP